MELGQSHIAASWSLISSIEKNQTSKTQSGCVSNEFSDRQSEMMGRVKATLSQLADLSKPSPESEPIYFDSTGLLLKAYNQKYDVAVAGKALMVPMCMMDSQMRAFSRTRWATSIIIICRKTLRISRNWIAYIRST